MTIEEADADSSRFAVLRLFGADAVRTAANQGLWKKPLVQRIVRGPSSGSPEQRRRHDSEESQALEVNLNTECGMRNAEW